jgi:hypothetical protein
MKTVVLLSCLFLAIPQVLSIRFKLKSASSDMKQEEDISKPRNLGLMLASTAREQRFVQRERMKKVIRDEMQRMMMKNQYQAYLDQTNHEILEDIHRQYSKAKSNIGLAKHFLIEKMDNLYNNFIQPARWFY